MLQANPTFKKNKMKAKIDKYTKKIFQYKNEELPAFLIHELFHQGVYLPFTTSSLKMKFLACMANNVVVNSKKNILEFGTGISTIILARLFKMNNIDAKVTSVDESAEWIAIIKNIIDKEGLSHFVNFVCAPTVKSNDLENSFEYDAAILNPILNNQKFDFVIIDGPSAWQKSNIMSRASNIKHFKNCLTENFSIFVDNADREGEQKLVNKIETQLNLKSNYIDTTFAVFSKGNSFNFII